jgi:hypothetical protein
MTKRPQRDAVSRLTPGFTADAAESGFSVAKLAERFGQTGGGRSEAREEPRPDGVPVGVLGKKDCRKPCRLSLRPGAEIRGDSRGALAVSSMPHWFPGCVSCREAGTVKAFWLYPASTRPSTAAARSVATLNRAPLIPGRSRLRSIVLLLPRVGTGRVWRLPGQAVRSLAACPVRRTGKLVLRDPMCQARNSGRFLRIDKIGRLAPSAGALPSPRPLRLEKVSKVFP